MPVSSSDALTGPRRLGRYELVRRLARGGMGELYLGRLTGAAGWQKWVALKTILPHLAEDPGHVRRFLDEGRIAVSLNHGNLVSVLDLAEEDGVLHLVLEYVDGWDLRRLMRELRRLDRAITPAVALFIAQEAARGLAYAHARTDAAGNNLGIVHRDVSPSNILLSGDGQVKVTDFGIAIARARLDETLTGELRGKFGYMAPEQARGEVVDAQADTWSLAVVILELLSGRRLWEDATDVAILRSVQDGQRPAVRAIAPDLPTGVTQLLELGLSADAASRPAPITAFVQSLIEAGEEAGWHVAEASDLARLATEVLGPPPPPETLAEAATLDERLALELGRLSEPWDAGDGDDGGTPTAPPSGAAPPASTTSSVSVTAGTSPSQRTSSFGSVSDYAVVPRPGSRAPWLVLALALLVLAGSGAWFVWPGSLQVTANPAGAQVLVDGERRGEAPLSLRLPPGRYDLEVQAPGHDPLQRSVRIRRAAESTVAAELSPQRNSEAEAMVVFQSLPPGAMVSLDGGAPFLAGNARRVPLHTPIHIRMTLDGHVPWEARRILEEGETVLTIALQPDSAEASPATETPEEAAQALTPARPTSPATRPVPPPPSSAQEPAAPRFRLSPSPPEARVWINDQEVNPTATLTWPDHRRSLQIRGEAPGHQPLSQTLDRGSLQPQVPVTLAWVPVTQGEGTLEVRFVREPMVGTVYVDGERIGRSERLTESWRVPAGTRRVEVVHEGRGLRAARTLDVPTDGLVVFPVQWAAQGSP